MVNWSVVTHYIHHEKRLAAHFLVWKLQYSSSFIIVTAMLRINKCTSFNGRIAKKLQLAYEQPTNDISYLFHCHLQPNSIHECEVYI
jgi:hypothetical protein